MLTVSAVISLRCFLYFAKLSAAHATHIILSSCSLKKSRHLRVLVVESYLLLHEPSTARATHKIISAPSKAVGCTPVTLLHLILLRGRHLHTHNPVCSSKSCLLHVMHTESCLLLHNPICSSTYHKVRALLIESCLLFHIP